MRYLSVCSGIEAATVAWHPLGWEPVAFAEIDPFPSAVLKYHYPDVPNLGDITHFEEWPYLGPVDLVCGGTPCQAFSVAGLRQGLADPRGNLTLTYLAILNRLQPRWFVFENVPGLLSHNKGRTFAAVLWAMGQLGYGWCYRVLDAQYVRVDGFLRAVPQRRRRLFIVGYLGDWRRAAAVLSEPEGMLGYTPPRRAPKQDLANTIAPALCAGGNRTGGTRPPGTDGDTMLSLIPDVSNAFAARDYKQPRAEDNVGLIPSAMMLAVRGRGDGRDLEVSDDGVANALMTPNGGRDGMGVGAIAFSHSGGSYLPQDDITATLSAQTGSQQQTYLAIHADALNRSGEAVNPSIDAAGVSRLRPPGIGMTDDGSTFSLTSGQPHAVAIQAGAVRENPSSGPGGIGMQADLAYTIEARSEVQMVAPTISARTKGGGGLGTDAEVGGALIAHSLRADGFDASEDGSGRGTPMVAQPLQANEGKTYTNEGNMFQLRNVVTGVRRLMPVECERLMGFEDDYTLIPYRGRMAADGPRYKALGNSWAVNVARWVGQRIQMVEDMS